MELGAKSSPVDGIVEAVPNIIEKIKGLIGKKGEAAEGEAEAAKEEN